MHHISISRQKKKKSKVSRNRPITHRLREARNPILVGQAPGHLYTGGGCTAGASRGQGRPRSAERRPRAWQGLGSAAGRATPSAPAQGRVFTRPPTRASVTRLPR